MSPLNQQNSQTRQQTKRAYPQHQLCPGCRARVSQLLPAGVWLAWLTLPAALWVVLRLPCVLEDREALMRVMGVNVATLLSTLALLSVGLWWQ